MKVKVNQYMIDFNTALWLYTRHSCFCCILFNVPFVSENIHQLWYYLNVTNCKFESNSKQGVQIHIKKNMGKSLNVTNVRKFLKVKRRRIYIEKHIHSRADSLSQWGKIMFVKIVILSASPFIQWRCMLESVIATIFSVDFVM